MNGQSHRFGLTTLTCVVIASMIGSGVFMTSGHSLAALGSPVRVLIAWCIGGVIALCGTVAYGELARRMPVSGGEYLYLSRRLHPFAGFLAGWVSLTAGFSGAIALAAITFEKYAVPEGIRPGWLPVNSGAVAVIVLFGVGHAFLVRLFAAVQNAVVGIKLIALAAFLIVAAVQIPTHAWNTAPLLSTLPLFWSSASLFALASSVMWISLSYAGFNAAVYIASEARDAEHIVPRSLLLGTVLVTLLYLLLNTVFVTAAPAWEISGQDEVAAIAARAIGGRSLDLLIRAAVALGTLSSVAGMIMTGPRVFSRMADDGVFPAYFRSGGNSTSRTVLLQTAIAAGMVFVTDLQGLLGYLSTTLALSSAMTVATLLLPQTGTGPRLTWHADKNSSVHPPLEGASRENRDPEFPDGLSLTTQLTASKPRIFPGVCAFVYIAASLLIIGLMIWHDVRDVIATVVTLLIGAILWLFTRRSPEGCGN